MQPPPMDKARKKQLKEFDRERRLEKRVRQEQEDGGSSVTWLVVFSLLNVVFLVTPMFGTSWTDAQILGTGVKSMQVSTSLFQLHMDIRCGKNPLEDKICKVAQKMSGSHSLHEAQAIACSISGMACSVMDRIYWSSFIIFVTYTVAIVSLLMGALLLNFYWFRSPLAKIRKAAVGAFVLAPTMAVTGFVVWTLIVPEMVEVPRSWSAALMGALGGVDAMGLLNFHCSNSFNFGWCWVFSIVGHVFMILQLLCYACWVTPHQGECAAQMDEERRKVALESGGGTELRAEARPLLAPQDQQQNFGGMPPYGAQDYGPQAGGPMYPPQMGGPAPGGPYMDPQQQQQFGMPQGGPGAW